MKERLQEWLLIRNKQDRERPEGEVCQMQDEAGPSTKKRKKRADDEEEVYLIPLQFIDCQAGQCYKGYDHCLIIYSFQLFVVHQESEAEVVKGLSGDEVRRIIL